MTTISLPLWILISAVGLPSVCLVWLLVSLIRRKRAIQKGYYEKSSPLSAIDQRRDASPFQQNLINLQIDAVFDGLVALIETERIKLKSLLSTNGSAGVALESVAGQQSVPYRKDDRQNIDSRGQNTEYLTTDPAAEGENQSDMASHSELSQAELDLVMKMRSSNIATSSRGHKLEAVA